MNLGETIRSRRLELGLTQDEVSESAAIAKSYISQIETGVRRSPPSEPVLRRLERALALDSGTLIELGRWEATPASVKRLVRDIDGRATHLAEALRAAAGLDVQRPNGASVCGAEIHHGSGGASATPRASQRSALDDLFRSGVLARLIGGTAHNPGQLSPLSSSNALDRPSESEGDQRKLARAVQARRVPIINRVAAGAPATYTDLDHPPRIADEYVEAPAPPLHDPDLFAARVTGDSMSPEYRDGDIVIFSPVVTVLDGMDCFARLEPDHESTFKRVYFERAGPERDGAEADLAQTVGHAADPCLGQTAETEDGRALSGELVRLQPLNPAHSVRVVPRERVAGLYAAVSVVRRLPIAITPCSVPC